VKSDKNKFNSGYAEREYGVTPDELSRALKRLHLRGASNRQAGKSRLFTGDIEALLKEKTEGSAANESSPTVR
jgi:hypothetical protein